MTGGIHPRIHDRLGSGIAPCNVFPGHLAASREAILPGRPGVIKDDRRLRRALHGRGKQVGIHFQSGKALLRALLVHQVEHLIGHLIVLVALHGKVAVVAIVAVGLLLKIGGVVRREITTMECRFGDEAIVASERETRKRRIAERVAIQVLQVLAARHATELEIVAKSAVVKLLDGCRQVDLRKRRAGKASVTDNANLLTERDAREARTSVEVLPARTLAQLLNAVADNRRFQAFAVFANVSLYMHNGIGHAQAADGASSQAVPLHDLQAIGKLDVGEGFVSVQRTVTEDLHRARNMIDATAHVAELGIQDAAIAGKQRPVHHLVVFRIGGNDELNAGRGHARVEMPLDLEGVVAVRDNHNAVHRLKLLVEHELRQKRTGERIIADGFQTGRHDKRREGRVVECPIAHGFELGIRRESHLGHLRIRESRAPDRLDGGGKRDRGHGFRQIAAGERHPGNRLAVEGFRQGDCGIRSVVAVQRANDAPVRVGVLVIGPIARTRGAACQRSDVFVGPGKIRRIALGSLRRGAESRRFRRCGARRCRRVVESGCRIAENRFLQRLSARRRPAAKHDCAQQHGKQRGAAAPPLAGGYAFLAHGTSLPLSQYQPSGSHYNGSRRLSAARKQNGNDDFRQRGLPARGAPYGSSSCAIWTAFSAAPLRIWSSTHQKEMPFSTLASRRTRPTYTSSEPASRPGMG